MIRLFLLYFFLYISIDAKSIALIVGVNQYKKTNHLSGAVADAKNFDRLFRKNAIDEVILLIDNKATRANIISKLEEISNKLQFGDTFYMLFSGHGTSLKDEDMKDILKKYSKLLTLMENSGAILPYDFDPDNPVNTLIIGSRDLRPIFKKIDKKGVTSLIVFDACFSGLTYRSIPPKKRMKYYPYTVEFHSKPPNPYNKLIYVASTSSSDWAMEDESLKRGYLSLILEKCLYGDADVDKNKFITKNELELCIDNSNIPQSPQVYPDDSKINPIIFKLRNSHNNNRLDIRYENRDEKYIVYDKFGPIATLLEQTTLDRYKESFKLIQLRGAEQFSLIALNQFGIKQKNYKKGEILTINIKSIKKGYLVLLSLNPIGELRIIEPYPDKIIHISKNQDLEYSKIDITSPYGTEWLKGYIIYDKNIIKKIQNLSPSDNKPIKNVVRTKLYQLLKEIPKNSFSSAVLRLNTYEN